MELTSNNVGEAAPCFFGCTDPAGSPLLAEPEQDGDTSYLHCEHCGNDFGWLRQPAQTVTGDTCAIGIPESVRRRSQVQQTPLLQIGRRDAPAT